MAGLLFAVIGFGAVLLGRDPNGIANHLFRVGRWVRSRVAPGLEGRLQGEADVIPLYGRLATGDQQQVFRPSARRKIVIATNIAETSLTIPGIRFVIDSGLARISRYTARTRTKRLPVEPVSRSSADQRKGRAGRVEAGVCIQIGRAHV